MSRGVIIILLLHSCACFLAQSISRGFEARKKNVPLALINNHQDYFHVLRYNKDVHDFTLERRSKPAAEIINFTPLKLDSINADWFDYENLDYLLLEKNHRIYFLFEKVQNTKREIFLKEIDTNGRTSGFIPLAALHPDQPTTRFRFVFKVTAGDRFLIVGEQYLDNGIAKKTAILYDPETREKIWTRALPAEDQFTGYSQAYDCNANGDLFYVAAKARMVAYKRKYIAQSQVPVPVFHYNALRIVSIQKGATDAYERDLAIDSLSGLKTITLLPYKNNITAVIHFSKEEKGREGVFFLAQQWTAGLEEEVYSRISPLLPRISEQLTFYDGTDFKHAADKDYSLAACNSDSSYCYVLSERKDEDFYKELILLKTDLANGDILGQEVIPRKTFYYSGRTRFRSIQRTAQVMCGGSYLSVLIESPRNEDVGARAYTYRGFSKVTSTSGPNLVAYVLKPDGDLQKKVIFKNTKYDVIPLQYQSERCEYLLYLMQGRFEKFAILPLNP